MAKKRSMICQNCRESSEVKPGFTFLGFPTMKCPKCTHYNIYHLSNGIRNFYIVLCIVGLLAIIGGLTTGRVVFPGLLFVAAFIAIYSDNKKRKSENMSGLAVATSEATKGEVKYCGQCGTQFNQKAIFCPSCGSKAANV